MLIPGVVRKSGDRQNEGFLDHRGLDCTAEVYLAEMDEGCNSGRQRLTKTTQLVTVG